jgi:HTH-type transcriptional regulator, glycine betaine synthesis regulator
MATSSQPLDPNSTLNPGEREVIAIFVQMSQTLGAPRSLGEIYGLLFASPQPLAFTDISDRLSLSKGSVSQGLRFLRSVGAITPVVVVGDRKEYYEPVVELRALVSGFLKERINPQLETWGARAKALKIEDFELGNGRDPNSKSDNGSQLPASESALTSQPSGDSDQLRTHHRSPFVSGLSPVDQRKLIGNRLNKLKTWQKRANTVLPMIGKLLG